MQNNFIIYVPPITTQFLFTTLFVVVVDRFMCKIILWYDDDDLRQVIKNNIVKWYDNDKTHDHLTIVQFLP